MNSYNYHWIGWENLQETMVFPIKYRKTIGKPSENDDLSEKNDDLMGF